MPPIVDAVSWGYWGVFWLMVLENVVPPVPSEVIMGLGGIAAARGSMDPLVLIAVGTAGAAVGNLFWYGLGRWLGYQRLEPVIERWGRWLTVEWEDIEKLQGFFVRWGGVTVFVFRFMPIGRTMISLPAGMMAMPFWRFLLCTAAGSLVWNSLFVGAGYWMESSFRQIDRLIAPVTIAICAAILLWYLWRVLTWKPRRP